VIESTNTIPYYSRIVGWVNPFHRAASQWACPGGGKMVDMLVFSRDSARNSCLPAIQEDEDDLINRWILGMPLERD
jgi:hypothetical protein